VLLWLRCGCAALCCAMWGGVWWGGGLCRAGSAASAARTQAVSWSEPASALAPLLMRRRGPGGAAPDRQVGGHDPGGQHWAHLTELPAEDQREGEHPPQAAARKQPQAARAGLARPGRRGCGRRGRRGAGKATCLWVLLAAGKAARMAWGKPMHLECPPPHPHPPGNLHWGQPAGTVSLPPPPPGSNGRRVAAAGNPD
jgi:hypothetical protein